MAAASIAVSLSFVVGMVVAVDSFYVRSSSYKEDREISMREAQMNSLNQEIATIETREAFTRYRLNDARRAHADEVTIEEYRGDLTHLVRQLDFKKRLVDQLRLGMAK